MKTQKATLIPRKQAFAAIALCLVIWACITEVGSDNKARNGWAQSNGIVVPHDSFPSDCELCHVPGGWNSLREDFTFDHEKEAGLALLGAHKEAQCLRCHNDRGPVARFSQAGCAGCHEDVHGAELGSQCSSCHGEQTWQLKDEIALHNRTRFPLVGAHAAADCWACHAAGEVGNWSQLDVACSACHGDEALAVQNPNHAANGWTSTCDRCHIPTSWDGAGFNHSTFALTGAHRVTDCAECHTNDVFAGTPRSCVGCHNQDYQQTTDPDHSLANLPTSCELCHDTNSWDGAMFSHASISNGCVVCHQQEYDATTDPNHGAFSISTSCEMCHATNTWSGAEFPHTGIVNGCVTCHQDDYNQTTDPNHGQLGISQSCELCHVTSTWLGASFDHTGIVNGCVNCHQSEYNQTTDPNHSAAGFPTSCETCHVTNNWTPANFNHSFPIDDGDHVVLDCIDCHTQPMNYRSFTCTECHEHSQGEMVDPHSRVGGYVWSSPACYNCHPNGKD